MTKKDRGPALRIWRNYAESQSRRIEPPLFSLRLADSRFPGSRFHPVFGGYPDDFWTDLKTDAPPNSVYLFDPKRAVRDLGQ